MQRWPRSLWYNEIPRNIHVSSGKNILLSFVVYLYTHAPSALSVVVIVVAVVYSILAEHRAHCHYGSGCLEVFLLQCITDQLLHLGCECVV